MNKRQSHYLGKSFSGFTLVEMLVVMILSGILFLLLFDGLNIVNGYGRLARERLNEKSELLNGHQTLELILEKTDSIRKDKNELLLFNSGANVAHLIIDSTRIVFYENPDQIDTLFSNLVDIKFHSLPEKPMSVDSIFLSLLIGRDTLKLNYGLSPYAGFNLENNLLNHEIKQ